MLKSTTCLRLHELGRGPDVDRQDIVTDGRSAVLAVDEAFLQVKPNGLRVNETNSCKSSNFLQVDVTLLSNQAKTAWGTIKCAK